MTPCTLLALLSLVAAPPELGTALRALDDLKYEQALAALPAEAAIQAYTRDELLQWFSTKALAQLGLKKEPEAAETFRRLFSLAPDWVLSDEYGPRVRTLVSAARAEAAKGGAVSLRFEGGLLLTTRDGFGFAQQLEVSWREPGGAVKSVRLPAEPSQPAPWPRETRLEVWGRVLGLGGSTLFAWGQETAPTRLEPVAAMTVAGAPARPLGRWGVAGLATGAAAVVAAGLGVGFTVASQDAERSLTTVTRDGVGRITSLTQRDAFALDARVRGDASAATGLFITAAVLAATGTGLVLFDRITAVPAPGGAALVVPLDAHFAFVEGGR